MEKKNAVEIPIKLKDVKSKARVTGLGSYFDGPIFDQFLTSNVILNKGIFKLIYLIRA